MLLHLVSLATVRISLSLCILLISGRCALASDWTVGNKTLLYIRIDFSDLQGPPVKDAEIAKVLTSVDKYFLDNSYGKLDIKSTPTPTLRMPRPASFYEGNPDDQAIIRDARAAAKKAGFDTARFTLDIVAFNTPHGGGSELAAIGGKGARILNNFRNGITLHAIGHNLGLGHARYWQTDDGSIIGPGSVAEYGDPYDPMGGGGSDHASPNHLSVRSKAILGWLGASGLKEVKASGTYRLYAQDMPGTGVRALRIEGDAKKEYWVEFRQLIADNPLMMNGVRIHRMHKDDGAVDLLNMNPASPRGSLDAGLVLGHTFADADARIYITPIALNKTQPPSIDVTVNIGNPPNHQPLTLELKPSSNSVQAGTSLDLIAMIGNPSRMPVVCAWDFGDGIFECGDPGDAADAGAKVTHSWRFGSRDYVVRACVTDLWGEQSARVTVISVGRPVVGARLSGTVTDAAAAHGALEGVRINVTPDVPAKNPRYGQNTTVTDSDGDFAVVGLEPGVYTARLIKPGYYILPMKVKSPAPGPLAIKALPVSPEKQSLLKKTTALRIHATIDGTDELRITPNRAVWKHLGWGWPTNITLNDIAMDPHAALGNTGGAAFLPANMKWDSAILHKKSGRGTADMYRDGDSLVIIFNDPEGGAGEYDMEVETITSN